MRPLQSTGVRAESIATCSSEMMQEDLRRLARGVRGSVWGHRPQRVLPTVAELCPPLLPSSLVRQASLGKEVVVMK